MIEVKTFTVNPFLENTYLVWDNESKQSAIIDPGCFTSEEEQDLKNFILDTRLSIEYLLNTHCHLDHIFGNNFVLKEFHPQYLIPELDKPLLENAPAQARLFGLEMAAVQTAKDFLSEETMLSLGKHEITFLFTPGHTAGEFCIYLSKNAICFTGDVLFENSIGRTDLLGGSFKSLMDSIKQKLFTLPEETVIYPGHGNSSTIGNEKRYNPFFNS